MLYSNILTSPLKTKTTIVDSMTKLVISFKTLFKLWTHKTNIGGRDVVTVTIAVGARIIVASSARQVTTYQSSLISLAPLLKVIG